MTPTITANESPVTDTSRNAHVWARNILKPRHRRTQPTTSSLETEVDRYLNDQLAPEDTPSLAWWQVSMSSVPSNI